MAIKERASLSELKEFCNKVREAGGVNPLDALLEAIPEETNECLIARNLNFSCKVYGIELTQEDLDKWNEKYNPSDYDDPWAMHIEDRELAKSICDATGCDYIELSETLYAVVLPPEIGNIASNFDETYQELSQVIYGNIDESAIDSELIGLIEGLDNDFFDAIIGEIEMEFESAHEINEDVIKLIADNRAEVDFNSVMADIKEAQFQAEPA